MVTNEERREIAARLRAMPDDSDYYDLLCALIGRNRLPLNHEQMGEFIANLIELEQERTCIVTVQGGVNQHDLCCSCNACSYGWHISKYDKPFSYCPNCGAKVVNEDD